MAYIKMRKAQIRLNYRETKPQVYKLTQLTYAPIKEKDLLKYVANSANVPESTVEACVAAIAEAIVYYAINGMRVVFPNFGGFFVHVRWKVFQSVADLLEAPQWVGKQTKAKKEGSMKACHLAFAPLSELRESLSEAGTVIVNDGVYEAPSGN